MLFLVICLSVFSSNVWCLNWKFLGSKLVNKWWNKCWEHFCCLLMRLLCFLQVQAQLDYIRIWRIALLICNMQYMYNLSILCQKVNNVGIKHNLCIFFPLCIHTKPCLFKKIELLMIDLLDKFLKMSHIIESLLSIDCFHNYCFHGLLTFNSYLNKYLVFLWPD